MKKLTAKSGIVLTSLLVVSLVAISFVGRHSSTQNGDCVESSQKTSNKVQSKLNLKGIGRHLLDFYK
ncbi:MAG: hypothetical protein MUF62_12575 [Chitinophagaceae bacterium]|jgi:hypothetical protein|nr:hypothetical protein [Chitinophagaceae bacterium]